MGLANLIPFLVKVSMEVLPFKKERTADLSAAILATDEITASLFITIFFIIGLY